MKKFEYNHNVINLVCGYDSSAVIVETLPQRKKSNKKEKRELSLSEVDRMSEAQIEMENKARVEKAKAEEQKRVPMEMRFRNRMSQMLYGTTDDDSSTQQQVYDAEAAESAAVEAAKEAAKQAAKESAMEMPNQK